MQIVLTPHVMYASYTGFVRHLENREILEFLDFSFKAWDSLKNGGFFIRTWKNP